MLREEKDYLLRLINQASIALARLRERLLGGTTPDEIVQAARAAQGELLGKDAPMLRLLDPASAAHVLGDKQILAMWADLLRVEADAHRKVGRVDEADRLARRAQSLSPAEGHQTEKLQIAEDAEHTD
jgi:hypothetical protein